MKNQTLVERVETGEYADYDFAVVGIFDSFEKARKYATEEFAPYSIDFSMNVTVREWILDETDDATHSTDGKTVEIMLIEEDYSPYDENYQMTSWEKDYKYVSRRVYQELDFRNNRRLARVEFKDGNHNSDWEKAPINEVFK